MVRSGLVAIRLRWCSVEFRRLGLRASLVRLRLTEGRRILWIRLVLFRFLCVVACRLLLMLGSVLVRRLLTNIRICLRFSGVRRRRLLVMDIWLLLLVICVKLLMSGGA